MFIESIKEEARKNIKTIVLPEWQDLRVLKAASIAQNEGFANIVLVGNEKEAKNIANENSINLDNVKFIDIESSEKLESFAETLYDLRKNKGMTLEEAKNLVLDPVVFGVMMVKLNEADGLVSGACHSTADTLRPALQIIRTKESEHLVSSFFIMEVPNCEYGEKGVFLFSDCALNENPDSETLAYIAETSSRTFASLVKKEPILGFLSYSTHGSKETEMTLKVKNAVEIFKKNNPNIKADGELQVDAAIIPSIAKEKHIEGEDAGKCNVLIFPDVNAGNIGYKLVNKLAKAEAYGPICQGIAKPVNDLSRGCSVEDIVGVIAITAVQALEK